MNIEFIVLFMIFLMLFICVYVSGQERKYSETEILHFYGESLSWLDFVSMKIEIEMKEENGSTPTSEIYGRSFVFRHDNGKAEWKGHMFLSDIEGNIDSLNNHTINQVFSKQGFLYLSTIVGRPPLGASISLNYEETELTSRLENPGYGSPIWGRVGGSNYKNIPELLSDAKDFQIHSDMENINGIPCYVLEGTTKYGKVRAWVSPKKGYNALKWEIHKESDHFFNKQLIGENKIQLRSYTVVFVVDEMQEVDGRFVMKKGSMKKVEERIDGSTNTRYYEYKTANVLLNPDFETIGAFEFDIPDGTRVQITESPGIRYTWQNGKMVPNVDKYVIDEIDKITDEIKAEDKVHWGPPNDQKTEAAPNEPDVNVSTQPEVDVNISEVRQVVPEESTFRLILKLILIGLFIIIGIIVWFVLRRLKA